MSAVYSGQTHFWFSNLLV